MTYNVFSGTLNPTHFTSLLKNTVFHLMPMYQNVCIVPHTAVDHWPIFHTGVTLSITWMSGHIKSISFQLEFHQDLSRERVHKTPFSTDCSTTGSHPLIQYQCVTDIGHQGIPYIMLRISFQTRWRIHWVCTNPPRLPSLYKTTC